MGDEAVVRREVTLALGNFGRKSLEARGRSLDVPVGALVRQAALYYLELRGSDRSAMRIPRFVRDRVEREGASGSLDVQLEFEEADWSAIEVEAVRQRVPVERLLEHAAMLFLADVDSGRVATRILEDDED